MQLDTIDLPYLTSARDRIASQLARSIRQRIELEGPPESFHDFVTRVNPHFKFHRMHEVLVDVGQRVADGDLRRVMVWAPSRMGKSEPFSRMLTAYYVSRFQRRWACVASYGDRMARDLAKESRDYYVVSGGHLDPSSKAKDYWQTREGGGVFSGGIGGRLLGLGYHLGVLDDPHKNYSDAVSGVIQERDHAWWNKVFYSRQEADFDAAIVVVLQRWDEQDMAGWLLEREEKSDVPEHWHVVRMPELYEPEVVFSLPSTVTVEPDWRAELDEPLCAEMRTVDESKRRRANVDEHTWIANHQQRPEILVAEGRVCKAFKRTNVDELTQPMENELILVGLDFNVTPMCAAICCRRGEQVHQVDEIVLQDTNTLEMAQKLKGRYPDNTILVYPDMYGVSRRTVGKKGETDVTILKGEGLSVHTWTSGNRPSHKDRANEVNRALGEPRGVDPFLFIDPRCTRTIESLKKLRWAPGTIDVIDKVHGWDHAFDALSFVIHGVTPIVTPGGLSGKSWRA